MADRDGRNHCRADPPADFKGKRPVAVHLDSADYRRLYMATMRRGVSMSEAIRQLIREDAAQEVT